MRESERERVSERERLSVCAHSTNADPQRRGSFSFGVLLNRAWVFIHLHPTFCIYNPPPPPPLPVLSFPSLLPAPSLNPVCDYSPSQLCLQIVSRSLSLHTPSPIKKPAQAASRRRRQHLSCPRRSLFPLRQTPFITLLSLSTVSTLHLPLNVLSLQVQGTTLTALNRSPPCYTAGFFSFVPSSLPPFHFLSFPLLASNRHNNDRFASLGVAHCFGCFGCLALWLLST